MSVSPLGVDGSASKYRSRMPHKPFGQPSSHHTGRLINRARSSFLHYHQLSRQHLHSRASIYSCPCCIIECCRTRHISMVACSGLCIGLRKIYSQRTSMHPYSRPITLSPPPSQSTLCSLCLSLAAAVLLLLLPACSLVIPWLDSRSTST